MILYIYIYNYIYTYIYIYYVYIEWRWSEEYSLGAYRGLSETWYIYISYIYIYIIYIHTYLRYLGCKNERGKEGTPWERGRNTPSSMSCTMMRQPLSAAHMIYLVAKCPWIVVILLYIIYLYIDYYRLYLVCMYCVSICIHCTCIYIWNLNGNNFLVVLVLA